MKLKALGLLRRAGLLVLVVWTVVSLVTLLIELVPGDPAVAVLGDQATPEQLAQFRAKHGLDRPPFFFGLPQDSEGRRRFRWYGLDNRYTDYWVAILHGDFGRSFRTDQPVVDLILERYPATIELAVAALLIAVCISIPLGVIAGRNRGSLTDNALSVVALIGISLPGFVIGPMLVYVFAVKLGWLAPSGRFDWSDIILPAFTLGAALSAILTRMVRSSVIEELSEGYVRTARAKGLSESSDGFRIAIGHFAGWRHYHRKNLWLARAGSAAGRRRDRQTGLSSGSGLRAGDQHNLYSGELANRHDLQLA